MIYPKEYGDDPLFPQASDFNIEFKNHVAGTGVICLKPFKKGSIIAKLAGEIVGSIREHSFQIKPNKHLDDDYFIGHFLHSCDPNTAIDTTALVATAIKDIAAGDYISIDYSATEDYLFRQFKCNCGSKKCRGVIAGKKETPRTTLSLIEHYDDDSDSDY